MKYLYFYLVVTLFTVACNSSNQGDNGPDLSTMVEGVYKINYIALNGVNGSNISSSNYNVLVYRKGYTRCDISEVINNTQTYFSEVPLTDVGNNKIEFAQTNGTAFIKGSFFNGLLEYTLTTGTNFKNVTAKR